MRLFVTLVAALTLGACNMVITEAPLFVESDAPGAPRLREGLWLLDDPEIGAGADRPCRIDVRQPATRWPECADWMLVRDGEILTYDGDGDGGAWDVTRYVIAASEPSVMQIDIPQDDGAPRYAYQRLVVRARSADGRIEAYRWIFIACGPPPPKGSTWPDGKTRYLTFELAPGMTATGENCTTTSPDVLIAAARGEEDLTPDEWPGAHWVRDTYP